MEDSSTAHCPRCGASLARGSVDGLCAKCLGALNFVTDTVLPGEVAAALPPPKPEEIAAHFPQLEIIEVLGRGGMGVVYKARQKTLGRLVALKLLAPERVADAKFAERFAHEAKALATLNHPSIVTVHDFGQAGGFYFLLMEFVDGVNLRQAMRGGRFTPEQALAIVPPVCEALQCAHDHGIVHRDIKPENLLIDKAGMVKIADFGIAKILGTEASGVGLSESQPAGTPQYMAPEQKAQRVTDHRADIYSLGVVLYEMLTGELPADKLQPPSKRVQVDIRIDEIVLRALEKSPELRYQSAVEFRTQVDTFTGTPRAAVPATNPAAVAAGLLKSERGRVTWDDASGRKLFSPLMGEVALYGDRLVISLGANKRVIPLEQVRGLREAVPPVWWAPAGHSYGAVEFDEGGQRRTVAFLPGTAVFRSVGDTQRHVAEWLSALQAAVQTATGRNMALTPGRARLPFAGTATALLWVAPLVVLAVLMLTILSDRRPGQPFPIGIIFPFIILAGVLAVAVWSRFFRSPVAEQPVSASVPDAVLSAATPAHFSRAAVVGACWVAVTVLSLAAVVPSSLQTTGGPTTGPEWWQLAILIPAMILGVTGPFVTTILGWVAVSQIRRSAGRIHGLQLALFDGLLYPLMALGGVIAVAAVALTKMYVDFYANPSVIGHAGAPLVTRMANWLSLNQEVVVFAGVAVAIVVSGLIARSVMRAARREVDPHRGSATSNEIKVASIALIFALIGTALGALAALHAEGVWPAMVLSWSFAGLAILFSLSVRRMSAGKCALIIAALGMIIWPLMAFVVRQGRTAGVANGIERVEITEERAVVHQPQYDGDGMLITFGPTNNRWTPASVYLESLFEITLESSWFESGASWVVKSRRGIYARYRLDGPPGSMNGKIAFHPGIPKRETDGSYVIGEFRPDGGEPLPISVRLDKTGPARPAPALEEGNVLHSP